MPGDLGGFDFITGEIIELCLCFDSSGDYVDFLFLFVTGCDFVSIVIVDYCLFVQMEQSLSSLAFKGSIGEAILESKNQRKLFVVFISGKFCFSYLSQRFC